MLLIRYRPAFALFALLAGIYLLTTGGHTYASDEEQMFAVTEALATRGSFALNEATATQPARYSSYGPGQSLIAVPFYQIGRVVAAQFPPEAYAFVTRAAISWLNPLVTAATGAAIVVAGLRLGCSQQAAVGGGLIYGLASMAWPHSKTFFAEPLAAGLLFASFALLVGSNRRPSWIWFVSGMLAGLAPAVKIHAGLTLPFLGLWILGSAVFLVSPLRSGGGREGLDGQDGLYRRLLPVVIWGAGAVGALALLGLYQWYAFGTPFSSGYGNASGIFTYDLGKGLFGLLFSSGKGIIWYTPPLLLWPLAIVLLWRRNQPVALLCAALAVAHLLFYGKVIFWHGDGAWGPRYLNMCLPFLCFPLMMLLDGQGGRVLRPLLAFTLLLAVPVQLGAISTNLNAYLETQRDDPLRYYNPYWSPIAGHLRLAAGRLNGMAERAFAPASVVLGPGFDYSEGDRAKGEQMPRWSREQATISLRPDAGPLWVTLALDGCRPAGLAPAEFRLAIDASTISGTACPTRVYRMLLPGEPTLITIDTTAWDPTAAGIDRNGPLGVRLQALTARSGEQRLIVRGELIPIPPMPAGHVALRNWTGDPRYAHWDFWWWYLWVGQPASVGRWFLTIGWAAMGGILILVGMVQLRTRTGQALSLRGI
jgi:hypothetical protein